MNLQGVPLQVLLVTADGRRSLVSTFDTKFRIGPIDNKATRFDISSALVLDRMPSVDRNFPVAENLCAFKNLADLVQGNKFPELYDSELHLIIGIREASIISYDKIRKLLKAVEPFAGCCKIGWISIWSRPVSKNKHLRVAILFTSWRSY